MCKPILGWHSGQYSARPFKFVRKSRESYRLHEMFIYLFMDYLVTTKVAQIQVWRMVQNVMNGKGCERKRMLPNFR